MTNTDSLATKPRRTRPPAKKLERVVVTPVAMTLLDEWCATAKALFPADFEPSRVEVLHVILMGHPPTLSRPEIAALWKRCTDPLRFARAIKKRIEQATLEGRDISIEEAMKDLKPKFPTAYPSVGGKPAAAPSHKGAKNSETQDHPPSGG